MRTSENAFFFFICCTNLNCQGFILAKLDNLVITETFCIWTKGKKLFKKKKLLKRKKKKIILLFFPFEKVENAIFTFSPDTAPASLMGVVWHD